MKRKSTLKPALGMRTQRGIGRTNPRTDWQRFDGLADKDIVAAVKRDPGAAPILDRAWFAKAALATPRKERISIMLDEDVLAFFRKQGSRYQTRINHILRTYMEHMGRRAA